MYETILYTKPSFNDIDFKNTYIENIIDNLNIHNMTNFLIYGPKGSGKSVNIYSMLSTIIDKGIYNIRKNQFISEGITFNYIISDYHLEFDPYFYGNNDKHFVSNFLKNYISTNNILYDIPKIVYIKNADYLSTQTQMSLRRMIEKNNITTRFIFECSALNKIIDPLKSRFYIIRNPTPEINKIKSVINNIISINNIKISDKDLEYIYKISLYNKNIPNMKILFGVFNSSIYGNYELFKFEYINELDKLCSYLQSNLCFSKITEIREIINGLYVLQINSIEIISYIYNFISNKFKTNSNFMFEFIDITCDIDYRIVRGNKDQIHIELYIISIIKLLSKFNL